MEINKVMNEKLEEQVFSIISQAGDAKSDVMYALRKIKNRDYKSARDLLSGASNKLQEASEVHMELLSSAMSGEESTTNFLVVHAEDHFTNASFAHSLISELIDIFEEIDTRK
ncbi:PTS lactose/cellobiose transporter subunit IIA [Clostridium hydrogeniformans]|uniref:PTS lactose/cellobiose transporter subunit IIA n=1 Tax=Clostridium hydrogeniformans TaxID=349933 RepID=UPI000AF0D2C5|nr:PTS lactose/cellobiose transporter subunit IIA [Clostridium hydrogeniformans]